MASVLVLAALAAGCIQIETRVLLNEDGSATTTERLCFSKTLLDLGVRGGPLENIASLLTREAALERMKFMGKGTELVRHEVRDAGQGAKESIAVYRTPDLSDLRYASPFFATYNYPKHGVVAFKLAPVYVTEDCFFRARMPPGHMRVVIRPETTENPKPMPKDWKPPKPPSPADLQVLRDLQPVVRDMLSGLHFKLTFESYATITQTYGFRGCRTAPRSIDLLDFSDKNLDKYGYDFLSNEEIMLDLLQFKVTSPNVTGNVGGDADNFTQPLYIPHGMWAPVYFKPSQELFDRLFKGKTLDYKELGGQQAADFDRNGWQKPSEKGK